MTPKLQTRVQRYGWDKAAPYYDAGWRDSLAPAQQSLLELSSAQRGETVLDLACGTGLVTFPLASQVGETGHVIATDLSDAMVTQIQSQASARRLANITAFRANAEDLSTIESETCDLVTCALGLMYCPEPMNAMREAARTLRTDGRAVFAVWGARRACGWADIFPIVDSRVKSDVCPMFFRLGTGETLSQEMTKSGFKDVDCVRIQADLPYETDRAALDAAFLGGPVALAYDRFDAETKRAAEADYLESIAPFKSGGSYKIPGEFVICSGRKA
ncbi:MAG: class I SAM-dependent methyltransferase [Pseudomonadota bacterium]